MSNAIKYSDLNDQIVDKFVNKDHDFNNRCSHPDFIYNFISILNNLHVKIPVRT